jgi:hypothetical protein
VEENEDIAKIEELIDNGQVEELIQEAMADIKEVPWWAENRPWYVARPLSLPFTPCVPPTPTPTSHRSPLFLPLLRLLSTACREDSPHKRIPVFEREF